MNQMRSLLAETAVESIEVGIVIGRADGVLTMQGLPTRARFEGAAGGALWMYLADTVVAGDERE